jgi:5-methylthioribose kinase
MFEITRDTAADYLRSKGRAAPTEPIEVSELAGGVSNIVLRVALPNRGEAFVVKQSRGRLRVKEEWLCPVERIWREVEVLRICGELLQAPIAEPGGRVSCRALPSAESGARTEGAAAAVVPQILWQDRDNFVYAMSAAPHEHKTWKELLLAGELEVSRPLAIACGRLLGQLHAGSWANQAVAARLDDRTYFDQLRLDPYYRHVARVHADLAPAILRLIDSVWQHRCCLVHGDFSPKNLLVWPGHVMLIDFEVGHYGDPAFDLGFFLTHLVLKSVWSGERRHEYLDLATQFWHMYQTTTASAIGDNELAALEQRMLLNLAGCLLARVDGKSPVDYLSRVQQQVVRRLARSLLASPLRSWDELRVMVLSGEYSVLRADGL